MTKNWERRYDESRRLIYPLLWPLIKTASLEQFIDKRRVRELQETINPFLRSRSEKIIYYLRVYSTLNNAQLYFETGKLVKSRNYLKIALSVTTPENAFASEQRHVEKLHKLCSDSLDILATIKKLDKRGEENSHFRTKIQLGQNICILRLMKL